MDARPSSRDSFHIESHAALLEQSNGDVGPYRALDAIVVPTIRPQSLQAAAVLADQIGCAFVVLCSTPEQARRALSGCGSVNEDVLVSWVPQPVDENWLSFLTSAHPENNVERSCHADIARKRNVGLLLARLCGWRTMMFLDDDIRDLTPGAVSRAAALTSHFQSIGFNISYYLDNSTICHGYRLVGGKQNIFPGGSALVVDVEQCDTLFPSIYNEDWLFLFDAVQKRSVTVAGVLSLIAEGLYRLIHEGVNVCDATSVYWQCVLERRFQLIEHIATRLVVRDGPIIGSALMSLAAARKRLAAISPLACVSYIHAWRTDLDAWRRTLIGMPTIGNLPDAAKFLELPIPDRAGSQ